MCCIRTACIMFVYVRVWRHPRYHKKKTEEIVTSVPVLATEEGGDNAIANVSIAKQVTIIEADLNSAASLRRVFVRTHAADIFLVTTTDVPTEGAAMGSLRESEELEYKSIKSFFDVLVDVQKEESRNEDGANAMERHVVFSTLDNVRGLVQWLERYKAKNNNSPADDINDDLLDMKPLDDGGIVPHYSGKGRGGEYALSLIHGITDPWNTQEFHKLPWGDAKRPTSSIIPGVAVTLITLPFLHCNFALSAAPLPTTSGGRTTQWSIPVCLGDASHPIDMISVSDLKYIVPALFQQREKYQGRTIKLSGEKITMDEVAYQFSELFGKDVIYSPLTLEEMNVLDIPEAPAFAQMCRYLASSYADHDVEETRSILQTCGREPQSFQDWLLSHSDEEAFAKVGLTLDATPIHCVTVFDATSIRGKSVIRGLLADTRKTYTIRACICSNDAPYDSKQAQELEEKANEILSIDSEHITIYYVDFDKLHSCVSALEGAGGAFAVTDFFSPHPQLPYDTEKEDQEERIVRVIIDACAASGSVKHLVLSTMEGAGDVDNELKNDDGHGDDDSNSSVLLDVKARIAAYARARHISMTYIIMPVYSEQFFLALAEKIRNTKAGADSEEEKTLLNEQEDDTNKVSESKDKKGVCMCAEMLGPTVARAFDSYEVYAGHEIGLMTNVLSLEEAADIIDQVFFQSTPSKLEDATTETTETATSPHSGYRFDIVAKDLGQMFRCYSKTDAVKHRASIARTLELVPDAQPFKMWLEENRDKAEFREMLGLR